MANDSVGQKRELAVSGTENWQKFRTLPSKVQTQKNAMNII
jgi:hypothetical protein